MSSVDTSSASGAGARIGGWFRMPDSPSLAVRALTRSRLSVTEVRRDACNFGMTDRREVEDAITLAVHLRPYEYEELWFDGKPLPVRNTKAGNALFFDLREKSTALIMVPIHSLAFHLPRDFVNELCDDLSAPRLDQLHVARGEVIADPVIQRFANAVRPALAAPHEANELFTSHVLLALGIYVCAAHGPLRAPRPHAGGLSAWQERAAKALIEAHLDGTLPLQRIAEMCGLSTSHFAHAFKRSFGVAPHQWLLVRRVERAKDMLRSRNSLIDIALACGFSDQSHFTRVFRGATGVTPGQWRTALQ